MLQEALTTNFQKLVHFLQFARSYFVRRNPLKAIASEITASIKDFLSMNKKIKMARYRLNYQQYKLSQMEQIIAQNNEHVFLKGRTLNETR